MIARKRLLALQVIFASASLAYRVASLIRRETKGEALSAAAIGPSIAIFIAYLGILYLPKVERVGWYRIGMIPALLLWRRRSDRKRNEVRRYGAGESCLGVRFRACGRNQWVWHRSERHRGVGAFSTRLVVNLKCPVA